MVNYKNGKIYKIINIDFPGKKYYGSTVRELKVRLTQHRNLKYSSRELINGNEEIILIQNYPCNSKYELTQRERWFIEKFECLNFNIPNRTDKEYYQDNKKRIREKQKIYSLKNSKKNIEYQKIYREENKEELIIKHKIYYDKRKEYKNEKIECDLCGKSMARQYVSYHKKHYH